MKCRYQELTEDLKSVLSKHGLLIEPGADGGPYSDLHFLDCATLVVNRVGNHLQVHRHPDSDEQAPLGFSMTIDVGEPLFCQNDGEITEAEP